MFKLIKLSINLFVLLLIILGVGFIYFNYLDKGTFLTEDQDKIIETIGRPEQFSVTYLPQATEEGSQFVRQETWFYPSEKKKLVFLSGKVISTENIELKEDVGYDSTVLKSEDFDYFTTLGDVEKIVGKVNMAELNLPGFFDEESDGLRTYASKEAIFIFEDGYLTYVETLD